MNNRQLATVKVDTEPMLCRIVRAAQLIDNRMDAALAAVDLSRAKLGVLYHLSEAGEPISLTQLAGLQSCVKSNITNLIDRMQNEGLVERKQDDQDRRTIQVRVTREGKRLYSLGMRIVAKEEQKMLKNLDWKERDLLADFLSRLE